ncbi:MAG TPA: rhomboid family intramembrane serine protease [Pirellulales bacterium]|nr:rhomboid family intramembrane serine protease [Pirellulales bacterium]
MGLYDRDYHRAGDYDDTPGFRLGGDRSLSMNLVIVMGIVYIMQLLTGLTARESGLFTEFFSLHADLPRRPWMAFDLLTYGFLHSYDLKHVLFNGLSLWMFGRFVEQRYSRKEYATFFLVAVAFAGLFWVVAEFAATGQLQPSISLVGASGGVTAVLLLFCLLYPHQTVYLGFLIPIPAWVFAVIFIGQDLLLAIQRNPEANVAYTAHIGGALFAIGYLKSGWRLSRWLPDSLNIPKFGRRPKLRVLDPDDDGDSETDLAVDDILRKIQDHGQDSLTRRERRILQKASQKYQKKRQ